MATIEFPAIAPSGDHTPQGDPEVKAPRPDPPPDDPAMDPSGDQPEKPSFGESPDTLADGDPELTGPTASPEEGANLERGDQHDQTDTASASYVEPAGDEPRIAAAEVLVVETPTCPFCGAPSAAERPFCAVCGQPGAPLAEGTLLHSQYRIGGPLAISNTGAVYTGRDEKHKRDVAIKELLAPPGRTAEAGAALSERFRHEARLLAHLKHPCLPEILDHFQAEGRFYVVMPLLPTQSLQVTMFQRGRGWGEQQVRQWGLRLLELLEYLENRHPPAVHGEILPEHLILQDDGTPCLIGYGLAPRLGLRPLVTLPGQVIAPLEEPARTKKKKKETKEGSTGSPAPRLAATPRDDLYAVGATLHSLLTGRDVFAGAEESGAPFPPVRMFNPRVSVGFAEAVGDAVGPDPHRRFLSAGAMRAHLLQQGAGAVPPAGTGSPASGRSRVPAVALVVLVLALIAAVVLYAHENAGTTSPGTAVVGQHEMNPLVAAVPAPTAPRTIRFSDTFTAPSTRWPSAGGSAYEQGGLLWLADRQGTIPLKVTRSAYATGPAGFVLQATVRLAEGPLDAPYGIVAADHGSSSAENLSLLLRASGQWALLRYQGGTAIPLINWRSSSAVRAGHNAPNELRLTLQKGVYTVVINGRKVAGSLPAGVDSAGRVGLAAGPGAVIACDGLSVDPGPPGPGLEEDFLDNHRGWVPSSAGTPLFHGSQLRLSTAPTQTWRLASTARASAPAGASVYTAEAMLHVTAGAGGVVFARGSNFSLAAVVGTDGRARIARLGPKGTATLMGPISSQRIRTGYGMNLVRVLVNDTHGTLNAQVVINGGTVLRYAAPARGLTRSVALAAVGPGATVTVSALRIAR